MKIAASELTQNLIGEIRTILGKAEHLNNLSDDELNERPHSESWTVLECIEHLNRYSEFYLEEIEKRIDAKMDTNKKMDKKSIDNYIFKSGFLGNYSANSMLPNQTGKKAGQINKMTTFKDKDPIHSGVNRKVLETFIDDQNEFIRLLEKSKNINLNKTKVSLTIPLLKFNLGDTFRFVINHQIRHFLQIENILKNTKELVA
ncbi:DinB family protein [Bernardetia sp.]|uniref:DinB family protein n=1 Tax=Bernardetia sp. TaxID=1937974 RepID=UPI0025C0FA5C|nr:DinB family protein [Bernardetia sp.]